MFGNNFVSKKLTSIIKRRLFTILKKYKTPFYLYSLDIIRYKYVKMKQYFPSFNIFYSIKANPNLSICKALLSLGASAEVCSLGELKTALKVGFNPRNIIFVGPGKTEEEIFIAAF